MKNNDEMPKIGKKVQRLRQAYKMSLDDLASRSNVSKSVLSQLERDQNNPTLSTIWRICQALNITVEEIVRSDTDPRVFDHLSNGATPIIKSADGKCELRILGSITTVNWLQWYDITILPGGELVSDGHDIGTLENLTIIDGQMNIKAGDHQDSAIKGETLRYPADELHIISNQTGVTARAIMVVILGRQIPS